MSETATILEIQRMSTEDGPGIRTTVFFKGCSLACAWCHNPESIDAAPQPTWHPERCMGCGDCLQACSHGARSTASEGDERAIAIDAALCQRCGDCVQACPTGAAELLGRSWTQAALLAEVSRDRAFYGSSGGGVTVSGGEPALQSDFVAPFLAACRGAGLHTALDTCGLCSARRLLAVAAHADLVLFDLKHADPAQHKRWTGSDNARILANLRALAGQLRARDDGGQGGAGPLWIRTPLVPGATASEANLRAIGALIAAELPDLVARWELCAFNNLCLDKYRRAGRQWAFADTPRLTAGELEGLAEVARRSGVDPARVVATGPTRLTPQEHHGAPTA